MRKPIVVLTVLFLFMTFSFSGCAAIFYPHRQGNVPGRLDAGMFALDLVLLLFYIIPGVVALAIDFGTGAIWMDGGGGGYDGYYLTPDDPPRDLTDAGRVKLDKLMLPAEGTFPYSLPVRGGGAHVITLSLVTDSGDIVAKDTKSFVAGGEWDKIESELTVNAGNAEGGTLRIAVDGQIKAEIPVQFAAALK